MIKMNYNEVKNDIKQFLSSEQFNAKIENICLPNQLNTKILIIYTNINNQD